MKSHQAWLWGISSWPCLTFVASEAQPILNRILQSKSELSGRANALGFEGALPAIAEAMISDAISTSAIEGEVLSLQSVRSSIARRLGLDLHGGAPAARNVEGLLDVLQDASMNASEPLTLERLFSWHRALFPGGFSGMYRIEVGMLRTAQEPMQVVSGPVGRQKVHFEAPPSAALPVEMDKFLEWFNKSKGDGVARAAIAHLWFETLHPFDDGNGRIGRALIQLVLAQEVGDVSRMMTVARQLDVKRDDYYNQLEAAQKSKSLDVTPWVLWFLDQVASACDYANTVIDVSLQKMRFTAFSAGLNLNARQAKILRKLLDAGPGGFTGGMTTRKYASVCNVHKITAARDLAELAELGVFSVAGAGRSTRYFIAMEGWGEATSIEGDQADEFSPDPNAPHA